MRLCSKPSVRLAAYSEQGQANEQETRSCRMINSLRSLNRERRWLKLFTGQLVPLDSGVQRLTTVNCLIMISSYQPFWSEALRACARTASSPLVFRSSRCWQNRPKLSQRFSTVSKGRNLPANINTMESVPKCTCWRAEKLRCSVGIART